MIAHRLSTIRHADRILVLDDGTIAQAGSHGELMAGSGLYRDMVELQRIEHGDEFARDASHDHLDRVESKRAVASMIEHGDGQARSAWPSRSCQS